MDGPFLLIFNWDYSDPQKCKLKIANNVIYLFVSDCLIAVPKD